MQHGILQVFKKSLRECKVSEAAYIDNAEQWSKDLTRMKARGAGDTENAMRQIEREYGIDYGTLWKLRYRRSSAGVSHHKLRIRNPFQARIKHNGKDRSIGVFPTFEAARKAYEREANKHFGEFSPARILSGRDSA